MTRAEAWHLRLRTAEAMAGLALARAVLGLGAIRRWRRWLGCPGTGSDTDLAEARRLARHIERGAARLPIVTKCLPRAMALSRMLRKRSIPNRLIIAARPASARTGQDDLHAWVEVADEVVLGELPGPWMILFSLPASQN